MTIGRPKLSVTLEDILNKVTEADIIAHYFGITKIPCVINSPLRTDKNPSFGFHTSDGKKIHWVDYGTAERGGTFDLLMKLWNCSFNTCLNNVYTQMIKSHNVNIQKTIFRTEKFHKCNNSVRIECKIRDWENHDITYWEDYGVSFKGLKYAEIYPISHKIIIKNSIKYVFGASKLAYAFVEHKDNYTTIKIYQPFNKKYKWSNGHNSSVISLWSKIPKTGDKLIICSSVKDALCIFCQLNIPTLAIQGEGYDISNTAIQNLKSRYKKIFISLDTDVPGISNTKRLAQRTGFIPIIPDLKESKDYSDYYKSLKDKKEFLMLNKLFN